MKLAGRAIPFVCMAFQQVLWAQIGSELPSDAEEPAAVPGITRILIRSEKMAPGSRIWVKNRNGDVRVMGWEKEEMYLMAEIRDTDRRRIELSILPKEGGLEIETLFQEPFWSFNWGVVLSPRCEMTIFIPKQASAYFRTTNGSLHVSYLDGYARCETTNGDVRVSDVTGEVHMGTRNGALEAKDLGARLKAVTENGLVTLTNVSGGIFAETINGSILARNLNGWGEGITLGTTNGSIDISLGDATGEITAESVEGSLELRIPEAKVLETSKHSAHLKVPGKAQKISLRTTNGTITVRE
jgi:hypothetical protein